MFFLKVKIIKVLGLFRYGNMQLVKSVSGIIVDEFEEDYF